MMPWSALSGVVVCVVVGVVLVMLVVPGVR